MKAAVFAGLAVSALLCSMPVQARQYSSNYLHHLRVACHAGDRQACVDYGRATSRRHAYHHYRYHHYGYNYYR